MSFNINGTNRNNNNTRVDGATDVFVWLPHHAVYIPPAETVQEVNVTTGSFDAEQGMAGGAAVTVVTKSGTNQFHGDGYYFLRDSNFNANSWSANRAGSAVPYYHRDQLGAILGGPIRKNKTFFLVTYEYTHSKSPSSQTATFPTKLQFERYWYGPEFVAFRAQYSSWYQVPLVYEWHDRIVLGALEPEVVAAGDGDGATAR